MERPWARPSTFVVTDRIESGLLEIGAWLRAARRDAGMSQMQLERASGVDQTIISRLERGQLRTLRLVRLAAIVGAFTDPRPRASILS